MDKELVLRSLQEAITPDCKGVLWLTLDPLENFPQPFMALDYFTDGLLSQYVHNQTGRVQSEHKNLFIAKNFNEDFYLAHIHVSEINEKEAIKALLSIIPRTGQQTQKLLILNGAEVKISTYLAKEFGKRYTFQTLDLTKIQ